MVYKRGTGGRKKQKGRVCVLSPLIKTDEFNTPGMVSVREGTQNGQNGEAVCWQRYVPGRKVTQSLLTFELILEKNLKA